MTHRDDQIRMIWPCESNKLHVPNAFLSCSFIHMPVHVRYASNSCINGPIICGEVLMVFFRLIDEPE